MNLKRLAYLFLILLFLLPGCGKRLNINDARDEGAKELSGQQIKNLVTDQNLHIVHWDKSVEADVHFHSGGKITAENNLGNETKGKWRVDRENRLCVRYDKWAENDMRCYSILRIDDTYNMFTEGGGLDSFFVIPGGGREDQAYGSRATETITSGTAQRPGRKSAAPRQKEASWWKPHTWFHDDEPEDVVVAEEKETSWWKPHTWLDDEDDRSSGDFAAAPAPLSREMQHLLGDGECVRCDLAGVDLQGAQLKKADIEQADLSGANLESAVLKGANLKNASLSGANLFGAELQGADLSGANLEGANFEGANLEEANLEGAVLFKSRLVDAVLEEAVLKNANLEEANLHWADLSEADLRDANLKKSYLVKAVFYKADLTGADLTDAVIQRTNFDFAKGYQVVVEVVDTSSSEAAAVLPENKEKKEDKAEEKEEEKKEKKKFFFGLF